jgi:drug/metabolite transporter (DMT)-like permease
MSHAPTIGTKKNTAPFLIILAAILWSLDGLLRRDLYHLPPLTIVFFEHIFGLLILLPIFLRSRVDIRTMSRREWIAILVVSLFSGLLGTLFYTTALGMVMYIQFSVVVLLQQLQPLWAMLTAHLVLREPLKKTFVLWAIVGIGAAYLVTFRDLTVNIDTGDKTALAGLLALLAGMVWAASTSGSKIVLVKLPALGATTLRFGFTSLFAFVGLIVTNNLSSLSSPTGSDWRTILFITLSTGMVALAIYYRGLRSVPARLSAILELTWPASAVLIDYVIFHNTLSVSQIIGIIILLVAMNRVTKLSNSLPALTP